MGTSYYATVIYGVKKDAEINNEDYDPEDDYPDLDIVWLGYDESEESKFIVGREVNSVDVGECDLLSRLSPDDEKKIKTMVGEPCYYYVTLIVS